MQTAPLLLVYCICVVLASLAGGALPGLVQLTHRRMQLVMSFVGGLMLGVALLHLLPHSLAELGGIAHAADYAVGWMLGGLLAMFLLIRVFHVHAHEHGDTSDVTDEHHHDHDHEGPCDHPHHAHDQAHRHEHARAPGLAFSWVGLAFGLSLHTLIDGLALGAAVAAERHGESGWMLAGLGTFLAVALHKPLDALSITSLMAAGGWSRTSIALANLGFALMCPLGAIGFLLGLDGFLGEQYFVLGCSLAFAAGVFLCISLADLLPEVAFHTHDRVRLTLALALGVALAWAIGFLEPKHAHEYHHHGQSEQTREHPH
ncbi:MAG: ZIP family metal transporter [Planctomycetaceae bacterium]|nr:ZIP family metal transporter [Planctomycetaceae bacterium]